MSDIDPARPRFSMHLTDELCSELLNGLVARADVLEAVEHARHCAPCERMLQQGAAEFETLRAGPMPVRGPDGSLVLSTPNEDKPDATHGSKWTRSVFGALIARFAASSTGLRPLTAGFAGVVAAGLLVAVLEIRTRPDGLEYWLPEDEVVVLRSDLLGGEGTAGEAIEAFRAGLEAYAAGDAQNAAVLLERADLPAGYDDFRKLYLASALALTGRHARALEVLDKLDPVSIPQPFRNRALWIRYIALSKTGQAAAAHNLLEKLKSVQDEVGALARRRLTKLEK